MDRSDLKLRWNQVLPGSRTYTYRQDRRSYNSFNSRKVFIPYCSIASMLPHLLPNIESDIFMSFLMLQRVNSIPLSSCHTAKYYLTRSAEWMVAANRGKYHLQWWDNVRHLTQKVIGSHRSCYHGGFQQIHDSLPLSRLSNNHRSGDQRSLFVLRSFGILRGTLRWLARLSPNISHTDCDYAPTAGFDAGFNKYLFVRLFTLWLIGLLFSCGCCLCTEFGMEAESKSPNIT